MTATTFIGLFQGDINDRDGDAILVAVFSTLERAQEVRDYLSRQHTELKREANDMKVRWMAGERNITIPDVPDLYWDCRPVLFDPRISDDL